MKIWHQSLTTIDRVPQYRDAIINHVSRIARPDVEVVLHGMIGGDIPITLSWDFYYPFLFTKSSPGTVCAGCPDGRKGRI